MGDGNPTPTATNLNKVRPPPSTQLPPTKKANHVPVGNLEIGLPGQCGPSTNASWQSQLKCQKSTDANADAPIRTAWDSQYPVNKVLNGALGSTDPEKVVVNTYTL